MGGETFLERAKRLKDEALAGGKKVLQENGIPNPLGEGSLKNTYNSVMSVISGTPEVVIQHTVGNQPKVYGGFEKDGQIQFRELTNQDRGNLNKAEKAGNAPDIKTLPQLTEDLAKLNTPASIAGAMDIAHRVDARLIESGREHSTALDDNAERLTALSAPLKKGQKPHTDAIAAEVSTTRTELIAELSDQLNDLNGMKKKHPELDVIAEGSNPPISIRESMKQSITAAINDLKPAEILSQAIPAFNAQIASPQSAAPAPAQPAPAFGKF